MFHESPTATADMAALTGVLECRTLRRTFPGPPQIQHPAVAPWHAHLHGLTTGIHETPGLARGKLGDIDFLFR
jgi:hypothetical protein